MSHRATNNNKALIAQPQPHYTQATENSKRRGKPDCDNSIAQDLANFGDGPIITAK